MGIHLVVALVVASSLQVPVLPLRERPVSFPLFNGTDLDGWVVPKGKSKQFVVRDGVLQIKGDSDWLLTTKAFNDFVLTFEARQVGPDSVGGVLVRTLAGGKHRLAYEVQVANGRQPSPVLVQHFDRQQFPTMEQPPAVMAADGEWHHFRVECTEDRVRVWRDDAEVVHVGGVVLNTGPVGVAARRGLVELRNVQLRRSDAPASRPFPDLREMAICLDTPSGREAGSINPPRPIFPRPAPSYPASAKTLGIEGAVALECAITVAGTASDCVVVRRVSTELDAEALRTVTKWRFEPATNGDCAFSVLMTVTVNFTFTPK